MSDLKLSCQCEKMQGMVANIKPGKGTRLMCYCADCQAFSQYLQSNGALLDEYGGTQVLQLAPSMVRIEQGKEYLSCVRLTKKGLYRWYSTCCHTPIANTVSRKIPFVGLHRAFIDSQQDIDTAIGKVVGSVGIEDAKPGLPNAKALAQRQGKIKFKMVLKLLIWKLLGKGRTNPFYSEDGKAVVKPLILNNI